MDVIVTPSAKKQIKKLPKIIQLSVISKLKKIKINPLIGSTKLSGYKNSYRNRVGTYRIIYRMLDGDVYVVLVAHRKEVYLLLKRLFN